MEQRLKVTFQTLEDGHPPLSVSRLFFQRTSFHWTLTGNASDVSNSRKRATFLNDLSNFATNVSATAGFNVPFDLMTGVACVFDFAATALVTADFLAGMKVSTGKG
jgi:hypothetical protein